MMAEAMKRCGEKLKLKLGGEMEEHIDLERR